MHSNIGAPKVSNAGVATISGVDVRRHGSVCGVPRTRWSSDLRYGSNGEADWLILASTAGSVVHRGRCSLCRKLDTLVVCSF